MALHTQISVSIAGQTLSVINNFTLEEQVGAHSVFTISIEGKSLDANSSNGRLLENNRDYLGEICILKIENILNQEELLEFKGIVTHLKSFVNKSDGEKRETVVIQGKSTSICLDQGKHIQSFEQENLSAIIQSSLGDYPTDILTVQINPEDDVPLPYAVQFEQTAFGYLQYMAALHGEFLLYANDTLHFGKPDDQESITLNLKTNLESISLGIEVSMPKFKFFNHEHSQETIINSSEASNAASSDFVSHASSISANLFQVEGQHYYPSAENPQLQKQIDSAFEKQNKQNAQQQVALKGVSYHPGVHLGKLVNIMGHDNNYGSYRIVAIIHKCDDAGNYMNSFEAIPTEIDVYPKTDTSRKIHVGPQIAIVKETNDPDGLSRVKVQYLWQQADNAMTPWLWVATPYAGAGRGFHFIPEVGDSVLIGHENENIDRPFVQSALYTGQNKAKEWQSDANNVKAIRTRSGHTIELNDTEGEEKIQIYDNEGSIIIFDTQAKSLTINATENLEIGAKNIKIVAEKNIDIQAQGNITNAAQGDVTIQSQGATNIQATGDANITSNGAVAVVATSDATLSGANTVISGQASAELSGSQAKVKGSAMAEVSGGIVKIN